MTSSEQSEARIFREETVDVSRKYGISLILAGVGVVAIHHFYDPAMAAYVGAAIIFTAGLGFTFPYGNRVVQRRTTSNDE